MTLIPELARLAGAQDFPQGLIVYSRTGEFDPQGALFYSNRRVLQATGGNTTYSNTLYHNYKPLGDVLAEEPAGIILKKDAIEPLRSEYAIDIVGESHELFYAIIRKSNGEGDKTFSALSGSH